MEKRSEEQVEVTEQPSRKGRRTAAMSSISTASITKVLSGIDFSREKSSLKEYAKKNISNVEVEDKDTILDMYTKQSK